MQTHSSVCEVCGVDFHNVFVLNIHVQTHTIVCGNCNTKISYKMHKSHTNCKPPSTSQVTNTTRPNRNSGNVSIYDKIYGTKKYISLNQFLFPCLLCFYGSFIELQICFTMTICFISKNVFYRAQRKNLVLHKRYMKKLRNPTMRIVV